MVVICMQIRSKVNHVAPSAPPVCSHSSPLHPRTHTPNPSGGVSLLFPLHSCILIRAKTLIIILFFFKSKQEKEEQKTEGHGKRAFRMFPLFTEVLGECSSIGFSVKVHQTQGSRNILIVCGSLFCYFEFGFQCKTIM